ncbi:hypothetical protein MGYG_08349 [Nannizzia gypsea CBS 118893]|uniref:DNA mismatch repair protein S5 domain-containing protein n=1 Tax=Arthroderma gypseum (strain ATCC MYA-4604 / CBS 118893) TaxID=535722 RepID=E4V5G3_ARTGP|nr:hypothetical protein MGYG_08349 [Nannizzia gypsea CBS 118893]EFR05338.1 hypothetical protein MGYG_08349 [Nannizzia gypsea CBS 118893]
MTIVALGESTVRAIGSTSALPDPSSVVKELLDNALDAGATSVLVEISVNTLDIIQLKDNGSGILPSDRSFACKRNYTSKIQTKEDLCRVGGKTLGFRGQALASIAEMSNSVCIITRVPEEQVAKTVKFGRDGTPLSDTPTSHPVGTTVCVCDFLKPLPVRRQEVEKTSAKCILTIKKLLQRYVIARPRTRLSLRLLKSRDKDWIYAPSTNPSVCDAISKVIGSAVVSSCISNNSVYPILGEESGSDSVVNHNTPIIHMSVIVPKPFAECVPNINYKGQFVVIDGRPLLTSRGFGREVVKLFKSCYKQTMDRPKLEDPFLFLSLSCPPGIYDISIEPSKDDILFEDHQAVLHVIERAFKDIYKPETLTVISNPDTRQGRPGNQSVVGISSPGSTSNGSNLPSTNKSSSAVNPWTLSVAAQRLQDPESQLLTPRREPQITLNIIPLGSSNDKAKSSRASMRQTTLSLNDCGRVSLFEKRNPQPRSNGSLRRGTALKVPTANTLHGIDSFLQTPGKNPTRNIRAACIVQSPPQKSPPQTSPPSRFHPVTKSCQASMAIFSPNPQYPTRPIPRSMSGQLHYNKSNDRGDPGSCQLRPINKSTIPSGSYLHTYPSNPSFVPRFELDLDRINDQNNCSNNLNTGICTNVIQDQGSRTPMECMPSIDPAYETTIRNGGEITQLADAVKRLVDTDQYVKSGSLTEAFSQVDSTSNINYWTNRLHTLARDSSFQSRLRQLSFLTSVIPFK